MGKPPEFTIASFKDFVDFIEHKRLEINEPLWYRGCGNKTYKLTPSLYRHPRSSTIEEYLNLEKNILERFKQRAIPFLEKEFKSDWELLFFVQHFGIPTRLLDWSENPFIALYFAITAANYEYEAGEILFKKDAAIWVLDPVLWNSKALSNQSFRGILGSGDEALNGYAPFNDASRMNNFPVALFGIHNSPRIVAQRGTFTIFGKHISPMEVIFNSDKFPENSLFRITFPKENLKNILNSLLNVGITDSVVYPDLMGLAKEIKRFFKYEV